MTAPVAFVVRLLVSRTLCRTVEAETQTEAEIIARFLYRERGERAFFEEGSDLIDVVVEDTKPEAGQ